MTQRINKNKSTTKLLTALELDALSSRIANKAKQWLKDNAPTYHDNPPRYHKSTRGRKPNTISNPFYGVIGCTTSWGRYPSFAMDIIEGVARLDWHNRPIGVGGKSYPLSVRNLVVILETLPVISNEAIEDLLLLRSRHARRYFKATSLIIPWMLKTRPNSLIQEMKGRLPEPRTLAKDEICKWEDIDDVEIPSAEVLSKLHYDLRTLTQFETAEKYEPGLSDLPHHDTTAKPPRRREHPMKAKVMQLLREGAPLKPIARETGVDPKTIRKWKAEAAELENSQAA